MGPAAPGDFIETAGRKVCCLLGRCSADLDGPVLVDGDRVTGFDCLKELVAEQIDRDDAAVVPDVINQESGKRDRVGVLRVQHRLGPLTQTPHAHQRDSAHRGAYGRWKTEDRAGQLLLVESLYV